MNILVVMYIQAFGGILGIFEILALPIVNRWEHPCYEKAPTKVGPTSVPRENPTLKEVLDNLGLKSEAFNKSSDLLRNKYISKRRLTGMSIKEAMNKQLPNVDLRNIDSFNATEVFSKHYEQLSALKVFYKDMIEAEGEFDHNEFDIEMKKSEKKLDNIMCEIYNYFHFSKIQVPTIVSSGIIPENWKERANRHDRYERGFMVSNNAMQFAERLTEKYSQMIERLKRLMAQII